jgi:hypothetical protein
MVMMVMVVMMIIIIIVIIVRFQTEEKSLFEIREVPHTAGLQNLMRVIY